MVPPYTRQNGHHQSLQIITAGEGAEEREPSYTGGGDINWCNHSGKQYAGSFLKKLKTDLPYDPAVPLLGIHPEKTILGTDTLTPVFTAALFTIAETGTHPSQMSICRGMKKMLYMCTTEYYSAMKKSEMIPVAATQMDLE